MAVLYKDKYEGVTDKKVSSQSKRGVAIIGSELVKLSHKISSKESSGQVVHINGKYFRIKELG